MRYSLLEKVADNKMDRTVYAELAYTNIFLIL